MDSNELKKAAALAAVELVRPGMTLGLGTGSTADFFIDAVGQRFGGGDDLKCIPTSEQTRTKAIDVGLLVIEPFEDTVIDLAVDGADEIGPGLSLIKGGGGALMREKIVAQSAKRFIVIADGSKHVGHLGAFPLPVEIEPALFALTIAKIRSVLSSFGFDQPSLQLRSAGDAGPFITNGGRYIVDIDLERIDTPAELDAALREIAGVTETGLFVGLADMCLVADEAGVRELWP
ncbi:MAG: ribose-5-phosphate isomerase RpiA [Pseudomonadota bacterium]